MPTKGVVHENTLKVYWLAAVADDTLAEITTGEIAAGIELTPQITADGYQVGGTDNVATIAMLDTGQIAEYPGTYSRSVTLQFRRMREAVDDVAWETLEHGSEGVLVVSSFGDAVEGSRVEAYAAASFSARKMAAGANTFQQYTVQFGFTHWDEKALVVAGS